MLNVRNLTQGAIGGVTGGVVFGVMMGMMGMLPMIGKMVGHPSAVTGFISHLIISALIGASFAFLFQSLVNGLGTGTAFGSLYGAAWWLLGPLTLMPLFMGMGFGVNWNAAAAAKMLPSLMGHIVFGLLLGFSYGWLKTKTKVREALSAT